MRYEKPFDTADDNETAARDCSVVCLCNVKVADPIEPRPAPPDPWAACDCPWCESMAALGLSRPSPICWGSDQ